MGTVCQSADAANQCSGPTIEQPPVSPYDIEISMDFLWTVAFAIEGNYDDEKGCTSTVVQCGKDLAGGWQ